MKKGALITCHNIKNYGSVFQTYATTLIFKSYDYDITVIDYQRPGTDPIGFRKKIIKESHLAKKPLIKYIFPLILRPSFNKMESVFGDFIKKWFKLTERTFYTEQDLIENYPSADLYISGSDQIWNSSINGRLERAYFLSFVPTEKKKISFASSFGKVSLSDNEIAETKELLRSYDFISTREESGERIVSELGLSAKAILDPTLWIESKYWKELSEPIKTPSHFILIYQLHNNKMMDEYVKGLQKHFDIPCLRIDLYYHYIIKSGKHIICPTPGQVIELIRKADYIVSDSFHMTVFSILFEKKFLSIYSDNSYNDRIENILNWLDLSERKLSNYNEYTMLEKSIDYNHVNQLLQKKRVELRKWLRDKLEGI